MEPVEKGSDEVFIPPRPAPARFRDPETAATINEEQPAGYWPTEYCPRPPKE
jgi:hypothetical protein